MFFYKIFIVLLVTAISNTYLKFSLCILRCKLRLKFPTILRRPDPMDCKEHLSGTGGVAQLVELFPRMHKPVCWIPSMA